MGKTGSKRKTVEYNGILYKSYKEFAQSNNIPVNIFYDRIHLGWTIEEIVYGKRLTSMQSGTSGRTIIVKGISLTSELEMTRYFKVPYSRFRSRMKIPGCTYEQALGLEPLKLYQRKGTQFIIAGRMFKSANEVGRAYNIHPYNFLQKLENGYTPEQAVGLEKSYKKYIDFIDEIYNKLKVKKYLYTGRDGLWYFDCECTCGKHIVVNNEELLNNKVTSCGKCNNG